MATANTASGQEFGNWMNLPSMSEEFAKTAAGGFNPLMYVAGSALKQLTGTSDTTNKMQGKPVGSIPPTLPNTLGPTSTAPSPINYGITDQSNIPQNPMATPVGNTTEPAQSGLLTDLWHSLSFNQLGNK